MNAARAGSWALACALVACAGAPEPPAPAAPAPAAAAPAPLSPEQQRLARFKEGAAAADPRDGFARAAEAEMERRRSEAIAANVSPRSDGIEAEMRGQQLEELAAWRGGCFAEEPDFDGQDEWIRHRTLERADFRATEPSDDVKPAVSIPGGRLEAYVAVRLACVVHTRVVEGDDGGFTAELESVHYFSLVSREQSWWSPEARTKPEWILRHEQLHFDIAELFAAEQNANVARVREETRERRPDPETAAYALRVHLAEYLAAQQKSFEEVERQYDRETLHGADFERQTEWFGRVKRGLAAVRPSR
jgi:predicted DNA-binding ribbon-helix-helix protein